MELLKTVEKIEEDCYSGRYKEALDEVSGFIDEISEKAEKNKDLLPVLKTMMLSMENDDSIMIGDCLEYGIKPIIKGQSIPRDIFDYDLNQLPDVGEDIFYYASFTDEPVLCVKNSDGKIIRLNSLFSPIDEVKVWVDELKINSKTPVVCLFGLGTGLFAEAVLRKLSDEAPLLIYEPNRNIIDYSLKKDDDSELDEAERKISDRIKRILGDKRVTLTIESENKASFRYKLDEVLNYMEFPGLIIARHNNYDKAFPESCLTFIREISDYHRKVITNRNTMELFKESIVLNSIKNLRLYKNVNISDEIEKILPKEIPAIIVSAGPSLDKNIDLLKQLKGHCLIFAVDTAVRYLLKKDIIPDLTITIDSKKPASYFSDEQSHFIPCVFDVTANPEIMNKHKGRIFLFNNSNFYLGRLFESMGKNLPMIPNGGSVATAAFALLYVFRQKKIILIGQDLASANGATHAGGVNDNSGYMQSEVEGYYGGTVMTRSDWLGYLKWFEKSVEAIKEDKIDIRVINATEGGAKIHGAEQMSLQEVIDDCRDSEGNLPTYVFEDELKKLDYCFNEDDNRELLKKHKESIGKLKEIENKAEEALRICKQLLKGIEEGAVSASYIDKEKKKITKIIDWCSKTIVFPLINDYLITGVIDEITRLRFAEGDIKTTEMNGITLMKVSFEAIAEAARTVYTKSKDIENEMQ